MISDKEYDRLIKEWKQQAALDSDQFESALKDPTDPFPKDPISRYLDNTETSLKAAVITALVTNISTPAKIRADDYSEIFEGYSLERDEKPEAAFKLKRRGTADDFESYNNVRDERMIITEKRQIIFGSESKKIRGTKYRDNWRMKMIGGHKCSAIFYNNTGDDISPEGEIGILRGKSLDPHNDYLPMDLILYPHLGTDLPEYLAKKGDIKKYYEGKIYVQPEELVEWTSQNYLDFDMVWGFDQAELNQSDLPIYTSSPLSEDIQKSIDAHENAKERPPPVEIGDTVRLGVLEITTHHSDSLEALGKVEDFNIFVKNVPNEIETDDIIEAKIMYFGREKTAATASFLRKV